MVNPHEVRLRCFRIPICYQEKAGETPRKTKKEEELDAQLSVAELARIFKVYSLDMYHTSQFK